MPGFRVQLLYMLTYGSLYCSTQVNGEKVTAPVAQVRKFQNDLPGSHETNSNPGIDIQTPPGKLTFVAPRYLNLDNWVKLTAAGRRSIDPGGLPADSKQHPPSIPVNNRMRDSLYPQNGVQYVYYSTTPPSPDKDGDIQHQILMDTEKESTRSVGQLNINVLSTNKNSTNIHDNTTHDNINANQHNPDIGEKSSNSSNINQNNASLDSSITNTTNSNTHHINNNSNLTISHNNVNIQLNPNSSTENSKFDKIDNQKSQNQSELQSNDKDIEPNPKETILSNPTVDVLSAEHNDKEVNLSVTDITTANQDLNKKIENKANNMTKLEELETINNSSKNHEEIPNSKIFEHVGNLTLVYSLVTNSTDLHNGPINYDATASKNKDLGNITIVHTADSNQTTKRNDILNNKTEVVAELNDTNVKNKFNDTFVQINFFTADDSLSKKVRTNQKGRGAIRNGHYPRIEPRQFGFKQRSIYHRIPQYRPVHTLHDNQYYGPPPPYQAHRNLRRDRKLDHYNPDLNNFADNLEKIDVTHPLDHQLLDNIKVSEGEIIKDNLNHQPIAEPGVIEKIINTASDWFSYYTEDTSTAEGIPNEIVIPELTSSGAHHPPLPPNIAKLPASRRTQTILKNHPPLNNHYNQAPSHLEIHQQHNPNQHSHLYADNKKPHYSHQNLPSHAFTHPKKPAILPSPNNIHPSQQKSASGQPHHAPPLPLPPTPNTASGPAPSPIPPPRNDPVPLATDFPGQKQSSLATAVVSSTTTPAPETTTTETTFFMFRPMQHIRNWFYGTDSPLIEVLDENEVKNLTSPSISRQEEDIIQSLDTLTSPKEPEMVSKIKNLTGSILQAMRKDYFEKEFKIQNFEEEMMFDNKTAEEIWDKDFALHANKSSNATIEDDIHMRIINGTAEDLINIVYPNSIEDRTDVFDTQLAILDSLQEAMEGGGVYDRRKYRRLQYCLHQHPPLLQANENMWRGILQYSSMGEIVADAWGRNPSVFSERNTTILRFEKMVVFEPCNFASNMAYYFMASGVCEYRYWFLPAPFVNALVEGSAGLAAGSSFFHGSHTKLGHKMDNFMISVIAYTVHQASLAGLPNLQAIITDLSLTKRPLSAVEISRKMVYVYKDEPVENWGKRIHEVSIPDYTISFSATLSTVFYLVLPESVVDPLVNNLIDVFNVEKREKDFVVHSFLPAMKKAIVNINLTFFQRIKLALQTLSAIKKLVFAFLWQEQTFNIEKLSTPTGARVGTFLQPYVNSLSSVVGWLPVLSGPLAGGEGLYPGEQWCKRSQPHSLWHIQSATGLLDYFLVADTLFRYTTNKN